MVMVIVGERLWGSCMWDGLVESVKEPTEMVNWTCYLMDIDSTRRNTKH